MDYSQILKSYQFSKTQSRLLLLKILFTSEFPLSEREIENRMPAKFNRTTIYRNLNSLSDKGIIQRIVSDDCIKYKLNHSHLNDKNESDHIHFKCRRCNKLICMEELKVKDYPLPDGYDKIENQFLIVGICKECNEK